jgi:hypothetical protein
MNKVSTIGLESDPVELQWKPALLRIIGAASCSARVMKFSSFLLGLADLKCVPDTWPDDNYDYLWIVDYAPGKSTPSRMVK